MATSVVRVFKPDLHAWKWAIFPISAVNITVIGEFKHSFHFLMYLFYLTACMDSCSNPLVCTVVFAFFFFFLPWYPNESISLHQILELLSLWSTSSQPRSVLTCCLPWPDILLKFSLPPRCLAQQGFWLQPGYPCWSQGRGGCSPFHGLPFAQPSATLSLHSILTAQALIRWGWGIHSINSLVGNKVKTNHSWILILIKLKIHRTKISKTKNKNVSPWDFWLQGPPSGALHFSHHWQACYRTYFGHRNMRESDKLSFQ